MTLLAPALVNALVAGVDPVGRLLERGTELTALTEAAREAEAGRRRVVLVYGEAGIGKTSVVREFLQAVPNTGRGDPATGLPEPG
jgi:Cdc6-like AAA superfamily ATPase